MENLKILCIEDSECDYLIFLRYLNRSNYFNCDTVHAKSMNEALTLVGQSSFDIIFLDLHLPDSHGKATLETIFHQVSHVPIIVMTDSSDPAFTYDAIDRGAQDFLIKSKIDSESLERTLLLAIRRKQFEVRMIAEKEDAEKNSQIKSQFLANMSHEIRTPLNGVVGIASIMEPQTEEQAQQIKTIRMSSGHLLSVVNNILDMSKIESGMLKLEKERVEIRPLLDQVLDMFYEVADRRGITLFNLAHADVPSYVMGDHTYIKQVCCNLINNAIKFTEHGSVTLSVENLSDGPLAGHLRFSIIDTGLGIPLSKQTRIFELFEQAESSTKRKFGGSGLGLCISKQLTELMGGQIGVISKPGSGSTFWFAIPAIGSSFQAHKRQPMELEKIHIVSDSHESLSYLGRLLTMRGLCIEGTHINSASDDLDFPPNQTVLVDVRSKDLIKKLLPRLPAKKVIFYSRENSCRVLGGISKVKRPYKQSEIYQSLIELFGTKVSDRGNSQPRKTFALRALVAEDDPVNQMVTKKILSVLGLDVDIAQTGKEAVEKVSSHQYDIVFMDCHMPEMDGYEAAAAIRQLPEDATAKIPIVALTADALIGAEATCLGAGMNGYLAKPVQVEVVREKIEDILQRFPRP